MGFLSEPNSMQHLAYGNRNIPLADGTTLDVPPSQRLKCQEHLYNDYVARCARRNRTFDVGLAAAL